MTSTLFWVLAIVVFIIVEAATVGLVSLWFAVGAVVALIFSFFVENLWAQAIVFLVSSLIALLSVKPLADKFFTKAKENHVTGPEIQIGAARFQGWDGLVTEEINNLTYTGRVKIMGQDWGACSRTGEIIPIGTMVKVDYIQGIKLFVSVKGKKEE